jgi:hypothetical protein
MTDDDEQVIVDEYIDCTGRVRRFRLTVYAGGAFLSAIELRQGEPTGARLIERIRDDDGEAFGRMRDRIRARSSLRAVKYLSRSRRWTEGGSRCRCYASEKSMFSRTIVFVSG